ncbi:quinon protein alcohol dehydrogenase-like superfamily [Scenedesmus sp. NREL 46B-D3]|nr:quinon protein alcohol dehydrogenase-like superfamily [Scenedesmus sp. NREL 46B-D3]
MDFSESYRCSLLPAYSPDGRFIAAAVEYRLVIREVESLKVVQIYSCLDKIHRIEWSAGGKYVLCGLHSRGIVQVWSVEDPEWACKIDEGPAGIKHCRWSPDGLSVVLVADFCVRMTIWSLVDRKCTYLPGPKHAAKGVAFSPRADQLAVLERKDCKDWLALYSASGWELQARVQLQTMDAADVAWSPDSSKLAVWDSPLTYAVLVLGPDGASLGSYSAYGDGLGVRSVAWSPGGDLLAVGSYDQVVRVLNSVTWQPLLECQHGSPVDEPAEVAVYQEVEEPRGVLAPMQVQQQQVAAKRDTRARYLVCPLPVDVTNIPPPTNKPNPKLGVSSIAWSPNSSLLSTVNENMPHAVWIWDVLSASLAAVLVHISSVRSMAWSPAGDCLAVGTSSSRVYVWTAEGASIVHIPLAGFSAAQLAWAPDGSNFALMDQEAFCCAYVTS